MLPSAKGDLSSQEKLFSVTETWKGGINTSKYFSGCLENLQGNVCNEL